MVGEEGSEAHGGAESTAKPRYPWTLPVAILLLCLYGALVSGTHAGIGMTFDEPLYLNTGRILVREASWEHPAVRFHGPLPLYFNQIFVGDIPAEEFRRHEPQEYVPAARRGMLPFGILAGLLIFLFSRRLFGDEGALLSLGLYALNPLMVGYGGLLNVDQAHAAGTVGVGFALWAFVRQPGLGRGAVLGVALGLLLATKYLSLLMAPLVVAIALGVLLFKRGERLFPWRLALTAASALGLFVVIALSLHASYRFRAGFASPDPASYDSAILQRVLSVPGAGAMAAALPSAYLLGVDMLVHDDTRKHTRFVRGRFASNHPDYYFWATLLKTPELVLLLLLLASPLALGCLLRRAPPDWARYYALVLPLVALPVFYLSFLTRNQSGVRYVLQYYPFLFIGLGIVTRSRLWLSWKPVARAAVLVAIGGWSAVELAGQYPNAIAYYNRLAGGQANGYRHFKDANSAFGQYWFDARERLEAHHDGPFEILLAAGAPRFGTVAIHVRDLVTKDKLAPDRSRHWLDPFEPTDHLGASWYFFEVTPEAFARAAAASEDPRVREELVLALLAEGLLPEARAELEKMEGGGPEELREHLAFLEDKGLDPKWPGARERLASRWLRLHRPDLTLELAEGLEPSPKRRLLMGSAYLDMGERLKGLEWLDHPEILADPLQAWLVAKAYLISHPDRTLAILDEYGESLGVTAADEVEALRLQAEEFDRELPETFWYRE